MFFDALAPSSALQLIRFSDVDAFRPAESMEDARSIPLDVANFAAARAIVNLPGCRIIVARSFARILDTAYRAPGGMVILPMTDDLRASSSGIELDSRVFIALRGNHHCHFVEHQTNYHALIMFSPALRDRGWFDRADSLWVRVADPVAHLYVRQLVLDILRTASVEPHMFETTEVAAHLQLDAAGDAGLDVFLEGLARAELELGHAAEHDGQGHGGARNKEERDGGETADAGGGGVVVHRWGSF